MSRKAVHNWVGNRGRRFADDEEVETEVRKWLRQQSKDFYAAGFYITGHIGQVYQCWWGVCPDINVFPPGSNITYFTFCINL
jgi:hypothetical protein